MSRVTFLTEHGEEFSLAKADKGSPYQISIKDSKGGHVVVMLTADQWVAICRMGEFLP